MEKTAKGLVAYALAQLGKPYWYGTFGQAAAEELYEEKKRQYPRYYEKPFDAAAAGQKVHDCVGLIKGYLWCDTPEDAAPAYNREQDVSANGMYGLCFASGNISDIPEEPGLLVFFNHHVGVYIGNGEVVEARGRKYGVVKTRLADRPWEKWGVCPYIDYEMIEALATVELPVLKKGAKGQTVKAMQILLMGYGCDMGSYGADGSFGGKTDKAVRAFQSANGLAVDGSCGPLTWAKLLGL